ncbi:MAG: phytoene desaturase family protein [Patescibacteria group bacterium]|nr:phytoene desaturase family protein [Patescibacteria group bacterium]
MSKKVGIIGGGLGGLAIALLLARKGFNVYLFEKNKQLGGRANFIRDNFYFFDTGPSWLLMDDIFEYFFRILDKDFYRELNLIRLDPIFKIFFEDGEELLLKADINQNEQIFERLERGSFNKFKKHIELMEEAYFSVRDDFIFNEIKFSKFINGKLFKLITKFNPFQSLDSYLRKYFKSEKIIKILEFNSLFLGTSPQSTPAIFGMINYFLFKKGVYYPLGGIYQIVENLFKLGQELGVNMFVNSSVEQILIKNNKAFGILLSNGATFDFDLIVSNADLYHTEMELIQEDRYRSYKQEFWQRLKLSPSAFILYLGLRKEIQNITHHNFYFCDDWQKNFKQIFDYDRLPENPSFYVAVASKVDKDIVPMGHEQFFVLVPIAPNLKIDNEERSYFKEKIYRLIEDKMKIKGFKNLIDFEKIFTPDDFRSYYNAFRGTALGPIHTLHQTLFRPKNKSSKINNLYYVGSYVNPGIGMPMVIASAIITYKKILADLRC